MVTDYKPINLATKTNIVLTNKEREMLAVTRISDKYNRLCNLATHPEVDDLGESKIDTLMDLAAYSIMTIMEIKNEDE